MSKTIRQEKKTGKVVITHSFERQSCPLLTDVWYKIGQSSSTRPWLTPRLYIYTSSPYSCSPPPLITELRQAVSPTQTTGLRGCPGIESVQGAISTSASSRNKPKELPPCSVSDSSSGHEMVSMAVITNASTSPRLRHSNTPRNCAVKDHRLLEQRTHLQYISLNAPGLRVSPACINPTGKHKEGGGGIPGLRAWETVLKKKREDKDAVFVWSKTEGD